MRHGGSVESEEGDIEDNRAPSITSSKSNLSELSAVSIQQTLQTPLLYSCCFKIGHIICTPANHFTAKDLCIVKTCL